MKYRKLRIAWSVAVILVFLMWPGTWNTRNPPPVWLDDERYLLYFSAPALFFAFAPLFRWRYSLRTLLIGMTVAAIGLGWIVYAIR